MSAPVLIVGAGPTGLVTAAELLAAGVPVRVIDRSRAASVHSRATSLWPRILELLDRISVTEELVNLGHRVDRVSWFSRGHHLGAVRFASLRTTPYPFGLALPQSITEDVLERRVLELGGTVERGHELLDIHEDADGVLATVAGAQGAETSRFSYLVGADGAHSTVRRLLELDLEQHPLSLDFAIGDVTLDGAAPQHVVAYCWSGDGPMAYASLGEQVFRIAVRVPPGTHARSSAAGPEYDRSWFQDVLRARGPRGRHVVTDLHFAATFTAAIRTASSFSTQRCFVLGDAAHVMSPAGGQGMNTGIQDAVNLSWKLAGVMNGVFGSEALATYGIERPPAVRAVAAGTARQAGLGGLTGRRAVMARDLAIRARSLTGRLSAEVAPVLAQLDTSYGLPAGAGAGAGTDGPATKVQPGGRLPASFNRPITGWPQLQCDRFTVVLWNTRGLPDDLLRRLDERLPSSVARVDADERHHPRLRLALGRQPTVALVRPDGHLVSSTDPRSVVEQGLVDLPGWAADPRDTAAPARRDPRTTHHFSI